MISRLSFILILVALLWPNFVEAQLIADDDLKLKLFLVVPMHNLVQAPELQTLEQAEKEFREDDLQTVWNLYVALVNLAVQYRHQRRFDEANILLQRALEIHDKVFEHDEREK